MSTNSTPAMGLFIDKKLALIISADNILPEDLAAAMKYVADEEGVNVSEVKVQDIEEKKDRVFFENN